MNLFQNTDFRNWLTCRFFSSFAKQMQVLVVMWQVYQLAHNPLALGLIGLAEALPYVLVGLWAGAAADRYEKKRLIIGAEMGLIICSSVLLLLTLSGNQAVLAIYITIGFAAIFSSYELPASSSYIQMIVPKEHFSKAAAWNLASYQVATIGGPILGGLLIQTYGPVAAYGCVVGLLCVAVLLATRLQRIKAAPRNEKALESIRIGLKFLVSQPIIFACMALDMFAVLFGDVIAILPVFAEILKVGPLGLGFLRASPAIGSAIVSVMEAHRPFIQVSWKSLLRAVTIFGFSMIVFALSKNFYLTIFALMVSGFADGISVIVRQSIYQAFTPDHLRGRVASVSGIFIRLSNEMGAFESGAAAFLMGTIPSVIFGGAMTLFSVALMRWRFPKLDENKTT